MLLDDLASCVDTSLPEPIIGGQLDLRLQPGLGLAAGVLHVYVGPGLFT
jgi:hypothetical protein